MSVLLAVVGAHLTGQPLNTELTGRGAELVAVTTTAPAYRLFDLGTTPPKPGLVRSAGPGAGVGGAGAAIEVEVWRLSAGAFGEFVDALATPMAIGHVELADGSWVNGFVVEPYALAGAREITEFGGWRAYRAAPSPSGPGASACGRSADRVRAHHDRNVGEGKEPDG